MKRAASLILTVLLLALVPIGCSKYLSHYKAFLFVHSNERDNASMQFDTFEGTMVFTLYGGAPGGLAYAGTLETGSATVYYDCGQGKTELFTVSAGEAADGGIDIPEFCTVYIIVETDGKCRDGGFEFSVCSDGR